MRELERYASVDDLAYWLCKKLCGEYEWTSDPWRVKSQELIHALIAYFSDCECYATFAHGLNEMYLGAVEDARLGRGEAEVESLHRDTRAWQQSTKEASHD